MIERSVRMLVPHELVEAARAGDRLALEALLRDVAPDVQRFARYRCRTSSDADDAAQETLWALYRTVGFIRTVEALPGWLSTTVRRECARLAQRVGWDPMRRHPSERDVRHAYEWRRSSDELRLDLAAAYESLSPHYREVVLLRDFEDLTIDDIAGALGITREAVKARLHRARLALREYLSD